MYPKIFFNIILIISLTIFQLSFVSGLPSWLHNVNFVLVILLFVLVLGGLKSALWTAIGTGFLLDVYSFLPFGFYLINLFAALIFANFLLAHFFTNRSLYSFFALTFFLTVFYELVLRSLIYFSLAIKKGADFFIFSKEFWINISLQIILNLLAVFVLFYSINFISHKLKPVFLIGRGK